MDWLLQIIAKYTNDEGKVDVKGLEKEAKVEYPKHVVPKEDFNAKINELKEANKTLSDLKEKHVDIETLQKIISEHEATIKGLQDEKLATDKQHAIESALKDAGATDIEYLAYKLGDVELDKDGQIKDLDNKIKDLQANNPTFFESMPDDAKGQSPEGFKTLEHKLDDGAISEKDATEQFINAFTSDITSQPVN